MSVPTHVHVYTYSVKKLCNLDAIIYNKVTSLVMLSD